MATRKQKLKVGVFLLLCVGIMTVGTLVVTGIYQEPGLHYWLEFEESILGLYEGGLVEYLGVPVGKVRNIYVTGGQHAHVDIVIDPNKVTLHEGVEGQLVIYSIAAGTMAVSLSGGNPELPELKEESRIPTKPSAIEAFSAQLSKILEDVSELADAILAQVANLDETAVSDIVHQVRDLLNKGDDFVEDSNELIREATEAVKDIRKHADTLVDHLDARSNDLGRLAENIEKLVEVSTLRVEQLDIEQLQKQFSELLEQVTAVAQQADETVVRIETVATDIVHQADNVEFALRGALFELRDAFDSIRIMVNQLKDDPSALIRGRGRARE